jgi:SAM-dependent methyltransferase
MLLINDRNRNVAAMNALKRLFSFNSSRYRLRQENIDFAALVPNGAFVLDAGAGNGPYRDLFDHAQYESADFEKADKKYQKSTYVCDLISIPVDDSRFDFIVFNQVLEHVPEPKQVLIELNRVLKPGGMMIYTGPLFYEEHEAPYDFYRYTQYGLSHLFDVSGFEVLRLDWLEGYFGTVAYQLNTMTRYLPCSPGRLHPNLFVGMLLAPVMFLLRIVFGICSMVFHRMETRMKYTRSGYPKNYVAIVQKRV